MYVALGGPPHLPCTPVNKSNKQAKGVTTHVSKPGNTDVAGVSKDVNRAGVQQERRVALCIYMYMRDANAGVLQRSLPRCSKFTSYTCAIAVCISDSYRNTA